MLQLMKQVDVIFDCFPLGLSMHYLNLAVSVGTPIVTLRTGVSVTSGITKEDMIEIRQVLAQSNALRNHPLINYFTQSSQHLPWIPNLSQIAAFYERVHLEEYLVANSTQQYVNFALKLLNDR
jgi:hypothetical protein